MKEKITEYFFSHRREFLDDIADLIAIPSVRSEAAYGRPFGENAYVALRKALEKAEKYGFAAKNYDGYAGSVDYNDKKTELNIFAHLDVVPAGDGWHTPPFEMSEKNGILYGRGVSDDKGPAMAVLYAMRALKDMGVELNKNVRLVLGTDEECGSSDLKYYFTKEKAAPWSFTPDANFPVTNGEKGRFSQYFHGEFNIIDTGRYVKSLHAGVAGNAVPSVCEAEVCGLSDKQILAIANAAEKSTGTEFEIKSGKITCKGISAHASLPFMGNNPITAMLYLLNSLPLDNCESTSKIKNLAAIFPHGDWLGKAFGVKMEDNLGKLTLTLDILDMENGKISGFFDARTPMKANRKNCSEIIETVLNSSGFSLDSKGMIPAHYVDEKSSFIQILLKNYEDVTGEKGECISMGGGTYVHNVEGGVAFGAIAKDVNTNMHGADEFMPVDDLIKAAEIYAGVIYDMCK